MKCRFYLLDLSEGEEVDMEYYVENQVKPAAMWILERFGVKEEQLLT
jgi:DNA polymerase elongation subunit (family B)